MKIYDLNSKIQFGKFKGSTLERIYVGKDHLTEQEKLELKKEYSSSFNKWDKFFQENPQKVSQFGKKIRIPLTNITSDFVKFQYVFGIEDSPEMFQSSMFIMDRTNGRKSYIEWCITTLNHFCIDPGELIKLEQLDYFNCQYIEVTKFEKISSKEYDVDFRLNTKKMKSNFSEQIKNINLEKYLNRP